MYVSNSNLRLSLHKEQIVYAMSTLSPTCIVYRQLARMLYILCQVPVVYRGQIAYPYTICPLYSMGKDIYLIPDDISLPGNVLLFTNYNWTVLTFT